MLLKKLPLLVTSLVLSAAGARAQSTLLVPLPLDRAGGEGQGAWIRYDERASEIQGALFDDEGVVQYGIRARLIALSQYHGQLEGNLLAVHTMSPVPVQFFEVAVRGQYVMTGADSAVFRGYLMVDNLTPLMPVAIVGMIDGSMSLGRAGQLELAAQPADPLPWGVIECPWDGGVQLGGFKKLPGGHSMSPQTRRDRRGAIVCYPDLRAVDGAQFTADPLGLAEVAELEQERLDLSQRIQNARDKAEKKALQKRLKHARAELKSAIQKRIKSARSKAEREEIEFAIESTLIAVRHAFAPVQSSAAAATEVRGTFRATWGVTHP